MFGSSRSRSSPSCRRREPSSLAYLRRAPMFAEHTDEVLRELGIDEHALIELKWVGEPSPDCARADVGATYVPCARHRSNRIAATRSGWLNISSWQAAMGITGMHPFADGGVPEITRCAATAGQIDGEGPQLWSQTAQFGYDQVPAIAGTLATVNEYDVG